MRVPTLDSQVPIQTPMQSSEKVTAPVVPNALPAAFGENVGQAIEKVGNTGVEAASAQIAHIQQMNYWDQQEKGYDKLESARNNLSDLINNDEVKPLTNSDGSPRYDSDHNQIEAPSGYLQRHLEQVTKGDLSDYDQKAAQIKADALDGITNPLVRNMVTRRIDGLTGGIRNALNKHIATEDRNTYIKGIAANTTDLQNMAPGATDPKSLGEILDQISENNTNISHRLGETEDQRTLSLDKALTPAVLNAAIGTLNSTGDINQAGKLIDSAFAKGGISEESKNKMQDTLLKQYTHNKEESVKLKTQNAIDTVTNVGLELISKPHDPKSLDELSDKVTSISPKLGILLHQIASNQGKFMPKEVNAENVAFRNKADQMFQFGSKKQQSDFMINVLADPHLSRDEQGILISSAAQFIKTLPTTSAADQFSTELTPTEEKDFEAWKKKYAPHDSGANYDLRGAFKAGLKPDGKTGHWSDEFKKPNHPTFSNESIYAKGDMAQYAGSWNGDTYVPPKERYSARNSDDATPDPKQNAVKSYYQSIRSWEDKATPGHNDASMAYLNDTRNNVPPETAYKNAIASTTVKHYPETAGMESPPNMVISKNSKTRLIFSRDSKIVPSIVYDPNTKSFVPYGKKK